MLVLKSTFYLHCLDAAAALDPCHSSLAMSSSSPAVGGTAAGKEPAQSLWVLENPFPLSYRRPAYASLFTIRSKNKIKSKRTQVGRNVVEKKELAPL